MDHFIPKFQSEKEEEGWIKRIHNLYDRNHFSNKPEANRFKQNKEDQGYKAITVTSLWNPNRPYTVYYGNDRWSETQHKFLGDNEYESKI